MVGTHWIVATEVRKTRPRVGRATFTIVASRIVMRDPSTTTTASVMISRLSSRWPPSWASCGVPRDRVSSAISHPLSGGFSFGYDRRYHDPEYIAISYLQYL